MVSFSSNCSGSVDNAYLHSIPNYDTPTRGLRSANTNLLSAPRVRTIFASRGLCCSPRSLELTPIWHSRRFLYTYLSSPS